MLAFLLLVAQIAAPQVRLAPDQPLPYVFADEPVIVEFRGSQELRFDALISYTVAGFDTESHAIGPVALHPNRPYWTTTPLAPVRYGPHAIAVDLTWPAGSEQHAFALQRIRRPETVALPGLIARIPSREGPWELLRRVLPAEHVSIGSDHPDLQRLLDIFAREAVDVRLLLRQEADLVPASPAIASVAIPAGNSAEAWMTRARQVREQLPAAQTVLESPDHAVLVSLLQSGGAPLINAVAVESVDQLAAARLAAEMQGYEGLPFSVYAPGSDGRDAAPLAWNAGAEAAEIDLDPLHVDGALTDAFSALNALIHLYDQTRPAGRHVAKDGETIVLRDTDPERYGHWIAPLREGLELPATEFADRHGNPGAELAAPVYAMGQDPDFVLTAIAFEVREEAEAILDMKRVLEQLPDEVGRAIAELAECDGASSMRAPFFVLLRSLPTIEETWHAGILRKADAVTAIAALERLVIRLGALEQEMLVPFVEPIGETLDRCAEEQAVFLTATLAPGASPERGEWLMMHLSELTTQARRIHAEGRVIEANAIAALAEWRSRALVHAAKARPLSEIEPEPVKESVTMGTRR